MKRVLNSVDKFLEIIPSITTSFALIAFIFTLAAFLVYAYQKNKYKQANRESRSLLKGDRLEFLKRKLSGGGRPVPPNLNADEYLNYLSHQLRKNLFFYLFASYVISIITISIVVVMVFSIKPSSNETPTTLAANALFPSPTTSSATLPSQITPSPAIIATPAPTTNAPQPPSFTPVPTATVIPPTSTSTPVPFTATAVPTATPLPAPTATPTPVGTTIFEDYFANTAAKAEWTYVDGDWGVIQKLFKPYNGAGGPAIIGPESWKNYRVEVSVEKFGSFELDIYAKDLANRTSKTNYIAMRINSAGSHENSDPCNINYMYFVKATNRDGDLFWVNQKYCDSSKDPSTQKFIVQVKDSKISFLNNANVPVYEQSIPAYFTSGNVGLISFGFGFYSIRIANI